MNQAHTAGPPGNIAHRYPSFSSWSTFLSFFREKSAAAEGRKKRRKMAKTGKVVTRIRRVYIPRGRAGWRGSIGRLINIAIRYDYTYILMLASTEMANHM